MSPGFELRVGDLRFISISQPLLHADQESDAHAADVVGREANVVVERLSELLSLNGSGDCSLKGMC